MRKFRILVLVVSCVFLMTANAHAQSKKIGYLDLSKLFDSYDRTKEYDSVLEQQHKVYEKERNEKIDKLKEAQGKLALLKESEKEKLQQEVDQMKEDLLAFDQAKRTDLTKQRDEKIREILLEIENVVSDFAKKEKYDFILNDRVLIYGEESLNVSDKILKILNDNYNKK